MYYLRTKPATNAIQFTVDKLKLREKAKLDSIKSMNGEENGLGTPLKENGFKQEMNGESENGMDQVTCSLLNGEGCLMCSS